ncbi:MAG: HEAT repeat domain-containing protein [Pseudomonadota bacterium]
MSIAVEVRPPKCPFCETLIEKPSESYNKKFSEFAMGRCLCGAVYACDVTGHNLGAALIDAMALAAGGDQNLMWQVEPERDYIEDRIENYDYKEHLVSDLKTGQFRAVLIFVRLSDEIRPAFEEKVQKTFNKTKTTQPIKERPVRSPAFSKLKVQKLVEENKKAEILSLAAQDTRVLSALQRLLYTPDIAVRWQIIALIGETAAHVSSYRPEEVANFLRRLCSSASDSAATSWGFLEAIGEIIADRIDRFSGFIPPLFSILKDESSRTAALWAIGRIAEQGSDYIRVLPFLGIIELLRSPDPLVRGHAAWALGRIRAKEAAGELKKLREDSARVTIYDRGSLVDKTVGEIAVEAIDLLE